MYDDFTRYQSTSDLQANISTGAGGRGDGRTVLYGDGHDAGLAELDRSVTYNGHPTMKYNQPGGVANSPSLAAYLPGGNKLSHMWYRATIRFSPNFTTTGTLTNSSNAYKLLAWGFDDATDYGSGRVEITNTVQYQLMWGVKSKVTEQPSSGTTFGIGGNVASEWTDGAWYDYVIEWQVISPTQGRARVWMGRHGGPLTLRTTSVADALSGYTVPSARYVSLGLNFNQVRAPNQTQAVWYAQWEVVDGNQYTNPFGLPGI